MLRRGNGYGAVKLGRTGREGVGGERGGGGPVGEEYGETELSTGQAEEEGGGGGAYKWGLGLGV